MDELSLPGLPTDAAVRLLRRSATGPIDPSAATAIVRALGGNPLALVDLAGVVSAQELAGPGLDGRPIPVGHRLEEHCLRRVGQVDGRARAWLLLAAADAAAGLDLIGAAADRLGIEPGAGERAESAGLVELADAARFRHPLVRSAVYKGRPARTGAGCWPPPSGSGWPRSRPGTPRRPPWAPIRRSPTGSNTPRTWRRGEAGSPPGPLCSPGPPI